MDFGKSGDWLPIETGLSIQFTAISNQSKRPTKDCSEDPALTLRSSIEIIIHPNEIAAVKTGLMVKFPKTLYGHLHNHNLAACKRGLIVLNQILKSNESDCEIIIHLLNTSKKDVILKMNDPIAKLVFIRYESFNVLLERLI